jgi:hypothetical protein
MPARSRLLRAKPRRQTKRASPKTRERTRPDVRRARGKATDGNKASLQGDRISRHQRYNRACLAPQAHDQESTSHGSSDRRQRIGKVYIILRFDIPLRGCILNLMRDGSSKLAHEPTEPEVTHHSAQVLQFRPRVRSTERPFSSFPTLAGEAADHEGQLLDDLSRYEQDAEEEPINYRHRMLMNVMAVVVVTTLVGVGVWLADTIAEMERKQDCVLQGRQNCAPIEIPALLDK